MATEIPPINSEDAVPVELALPAVRVGLVVREALVAPEGPAE